MKHLRKLLSFFLGFCLVVTGFPGMDSAWAASGTTYTVTDQTQFEAALSQAADGDIIAVSGTVTIMENSQNSLVIDKNVTITGDALIVQYSGILLGADVTFENITLKFPSRSRNAIMANGHTLTLNNVVRDTGGQQIHLFAGGMTGHSQNVASGSHGRIVIQGNTSLGNIYAGSISTDGNSNSFDLPATITIDKSATGNMGSVYACGALETPAGDNWFDFIEIDPPTPSATGNLAFPVTGDVNIQLYKRVVTSVDGETGGNRNATVTFIGDQYLTENVTLANIGGLSVEEGKFIPAADSSFSGSNAAISVAQGATLGISGFGNAPVIGDFSGGGTLILGEGQHLTIEGNVTGTTTVAVKQIFNGASAPLTEGFTYISAPNSFENSFALATPNEQPNMKLKYEAAGGRWTASSSGDEAKILVESFSMDTPVTAGSGNTGVTIPMNPTFAANSAFPSYMDFIPLGITVNDRSASRTESGGYYTYTVGYNLKIEVLNDELHLTGSDASGAVPEGTYVIVVAIPAANAASGRVLQSTATLTVEGDPSKPVSIPVPAAKTGLRWTGSQQVGVDEGAGYTLTGHKGTDVNNYTATATLLPGYQWEDGTSSDKTIAWSIVKAEGPSAPTGLSGVAPGSAGGTDGKITGVTTAMEYATQRDFGDKKDCPAGEITGLAEGTYYVRIKETSTHEAGASVSVTVPAYGAPPTPAVPVYTVTVNGSYASVTGAGDYAKDAVVYISAGTRSGYTFLGWTASGVTLSSPGSSNTSFTMPENQVTVTATWRQNSSSSGGRGNGSAGSLDRRTAASITAAKPGDTVKMTLSVRNPVVGKEVFQTLAGKNVSLDILTGSVTWTVNGLDIQEDAKLSDINLGVDTKSKTIPDSLLSGLPGGSKATQFSLSHSGDFGFPLRLIVDTGKSNAGLWANLYYYDAKGQEMEFRHASRIDTDGKAVFAMDHASDYAVIIDDVSHEFKEPERWTNPFSDVSDGAWYYDAVGYAYKNGMMRGTSSRSFQPEAPVTRGQVVTILYSLEGRPLAGSARAFYDVLPGTYYADAVKWASDNRIVGGYGNNVFGPEDPITREQLAALLYHYAEFKGVEAGTQSENLWRFADRSSVSSYAVEPLNWAVEQGMISGHGNGLLAPGDGATRAEAAAILMQFRENIL